MDISNLINENITNPYELESLYRKDPESFKKSFKYAWEQNPDSPVLAVWYQRLYFKEKANQGKANQGKANQEKASLLQKDFYPWVFWQYWPVYVRELFCILLNSKP